MSRPPAAVRRGGRTSCRAPAMSAAHVTTEASKRRSEGTRQGIQVMANTIAEPAEKASRRELRLLGGFVLWWRADRRVDFRREVAMVGGSPPANKGKREPMSGKSPQDRDVKKAAKMSTWRGTDRERSLPNQRRPTASRGVGWYPRDAR